MCGKYKNHVAFDFETSDIDGNFYIGTLEHYNQIISVNYPNLASEIEIVKNIFHFDFLEHEQIS